MDTGPEICVIREQPFDKQNSKKKIPLQAANGTRIALYQTRTRSLDLGMHHKFSWPVTIADVAKPILGTDFLCQSDLLVSRSRSQTSP